MAGETTITIVGNLTADPELRTTSNGHSVVSFTIAAVPRTRNQQTGQWEDAPGGLFMRCSAWNTLADHCAQTLAKGMRVIAQGRLSQRSYQAKDGTNRTVVELTVDEIGPSLKYATAQVTRQSTGNGFQQGGFQGNNTGFSNSNPFNNTPPAQQQSQNTVADPWSSGGATFGGTYTNDDDPTF